MKPRRTRLAPNLDRWSREETESDEQRLVIVRISPSGDPDVAAATLERAGAEINSAGDDLITVLVTRSVARAIAEEPWVSVVEEPTPLFPEPFGPAARRS